MSGIERIRAQLRSAWSDPVGRAVLLVLPVNSVFRFAHITAVTGPWDAQIEWVVGFYTLVAAALALLDMVFRQLGKWAVRFRRFVLKMRGGS